jgi:putative nucleotidyltransferase with HDIG domain
MNTASADGSPWRRARYRIWQAFYRMRAEISADDLATVGDLLPSAGQALFLTMSRGDQRHCLDVYADLVAAGEADRDLLTAALLHDVGKGGGRVRFVMRPTIVLLKAFAPGLLRRLAGESAFALMPRWRQPFRDAWHHAQLGAHLAEEAELVPRVVEMIRTHHDPYGPAAALHAVDEGH